MRVRMEESIREQERKTTRMISREKEKGYERQGQREGVSVHFSHLIFKSVESVKIDGTDI